MTTIKASSTVKSLEAEATGKTVALEFYGHTYALPPKLKMKVIRFIERGNVNLGIEAILGAEQAELLWERTDDWDAEDPRWKEFFEAVAAATGGNS